MWLSYGLRSFRGDYDWTFCSCAVEEALSHPYLARLHDIADEPICQKPFSFEFEQQALGEEQMKDMIYEEALALNPGYA